MVKRIIMATVLIELKDTKFVIEFSIKICVCVCLCVCVKPDKNGLGLQFDLGERVDLAGSG